MRRIKALIVLTMASFDLPIVPRCKGTDDLMLDSMLGQMALKKSRFVPVRSKTIGKFRAIIGLDTFNRTGKGLNQMFQEHSRGIGVVFLKGLYKTPAGILINGCVLEEMFPSQVRIGKAGRRNKFHIDLDTLTRIKHLLIRLRDVFRILWMNRHHALPFEETVEPRNGTLIAALHEFDPEDNEAGIGIPASHIADELNFSIGMLVGMMMGPSGAIPKGIPGAIIASKPPIDILPIGFIFDSSLGDAKLLSKAN